MKLLGPVLVASITLTACGGGGGSDSGGDTSVSLPGTALSASEFASAITSGLYRYEIAVQANYSDTFRSGSTTYTITSSGEADTRGLIWTLINSPSNATTDSCTLEGPETTNPSEFGIEDDEVDLSNCTLSYSQISATEFGIAQVCPDL